MGIDTATPGKKAVGKVLPGGRLDAGGFGLDERETVNLDMALCLLGTKASVFQDD